MSVAYGMSRTAAIIGGGVSVTGRIAKSAGIQQIPVRVAARMRSASANTVAA